MAFRDIFTKKEKRSFFPESPVGAFQSLNFTAETNPTVATCVNKIANTFAVLPMNLYAHTKNGKVLAYQNPLFRVLEHPAFEETRSQFYSEMVRFLLLKGNVYIYISRNGKGDVIDLKLVSPDACTVTRDATNRKRFEISGKTYTDKQILHIPYPGTGYNGTIGVSPIETHRELIELDNILLSYIRSYFENSVGSRLSIELGQSYPSRPSDMDKLYAAIMPYLNKFVIGAANAGKPMINLPDTKSSIISQPNNAEAQLQSLKAMVEHLIPETCFNIPCEVIDSSASKYNSLEAKQGDFYSNCIQPLGDHICQSFEKLLSPEDSKLFIQYEYKNLLTTDIKTTIDYLTTEFNNGMLTMNEIRKKLGMQDIGPAGDYHFVPANLVPLTEENVKAYMAKQKQALEMNSEQTDTEHSMTGDDKV